MKIKVQINLGKVVNADFFEFYGGRVKCKVDGFNTISSFPKESICGLFIEDSNKGHTDKVICLENVASESIDLVSYFYEDKRGRLTIEETDNCLDVISSYDNYNKKYITGI